MSYKTDEELDNSFIADRNASGSNTKPSIFSPISYLDDNIAREALHTDVMKEVSQHDGDS